MDILSLIKEQIIKAAGENLEFTYPPTSDLGDLSLPLFALAKKTGAKPQEVAAQLIKKINRHRLIRKMISDIKITGAYLNFFLNCEYFSKKVIDNINQERYDYGRNRSKKKQKIMVEYSNANTHKEYHVGHLRNLFYGDAVSRILSASGARTLAVSYINDFGIHVAKTLWGYLKLHGAAELEKPGQALGEIYAEASQKIGEDKTAQEEVSQIMRGIESLQGNYYDLWEKTRRWSIKYFSEIYYELNIKFDKTFYESEVIKDGLKIVSHLINKGILRKSEGAIIADLEEYQLGVLPIIRSDGTALYPVADLALAVKKFKKYHLSESIYIVDVRQSLYFKQLFKILELMGYRIKTTHLAYEFVTLPSGLMSSRSGNVITYKNLQEEALIKSRQEIEKRHVDWKSRKIEKLAQSLTVATLKFELLKVSANKIITFNAAEALRFDGYTATYLEYTHARLKTLLRKAGVKNNLRADLRNLTDIREINLVMKLSKYPETVKRAGADYDPSAITKYLFELGQLINDYYHEIPVIKAEEEIKKARLVLLIASGQVLRNGLDLLGIEALEEI